MTETGDFVDVAAAADRPEGGMQVVAHDGEEVLLLRHAGRVHAVGAWCTHEDAEMELGWVKEGCIHCPLHGSYFALDTGRVLEEPAEEDLPVWSVREEAGRILLGPRKAP
jgi:3-phenylpropionate/trans-cinnamate dioxygenase ferredoxin subunit